MPSIDPKVIVHKLNMDPNFHLIRQKMRSFNPERHEAAKVAVEKLLKAGIIKKVIYPSWLTNVVLVKKNNG